MLYASIFISLAIVALSVAAARILRAVERSARLDGIKDARRSHRTRLWRRYCNTTYRTERDRREDYSSVWEDVGVSSEG